MMKFIIEPINDTDCRITDIDCSGLQGQAVGELTIPATVEQNGKTYQVKEVGKSIYYVTRPDFFGKDETVMRVPNGCCVVNSSDDADNIACLGHLKKLIISEGIERLNVVMGNTGSNAKERGNADFLSEVVLPSTLKSIGAYAFANCPKLTTVDIPDSIEEVGEKAFAECSSLQLFQWPKLLKKVNISAFDSMRNPESGFVLHIPDSIEEISGRSNDVEISECIISAKVWPVLDASELCECIVNIDIPEGAKKITKSSLSYRKFNKAKHVGIPSTIEKIDPDVFNNTEISADENTMHRVMGMPGALNDTTIEVIDIPEGTTEVWVKGCRELKRLTIPKSVSKIKAISCCPKLEELAIPDSVEMFEPISDWDAVLQDLKAHISASPKIWNLICNNSVVKYRPENTVLTIPEGVSSFNSQFKSCNMTAVVLPSSLTEMSGGFTDCEALETITFPASPVKYSGQPILRCKSLKYVIFPADDPATATYPEVLGKKVDWYVPDNMVPHVKVLISEKKVDAKSAKPLSKLSGYMPVKTAEEKQATAPQKKSVAKKKQNLTKLIRLTTVKQPYQLTYSFAVSDADKHLLDNEIDAASLGVNYMRTKANECSLEIKIAGSSMIFDVFDGGTQLSTWESMLYAITKTARKAEFEIDFADPTSFPEDFPAGETSYADFNSFIASRLPAAGSKLPEGTTWISVSVRLGANVEFMIGEKEKFSDKKIHLLKDKASGARVPFCIVYGKRYIPATSIVVESEGTIMSVCHSKQSVADSGIATVKVKKIRIKIDELPLIKEVLNAIK